MGFHFTIFLSKNFIFACILITNVQRFKRSNYILIVKQGEREKGSFLLISPIYRFFIKMKIKHFVLHFLIECIQKHSKIFFSPKNYFFREVWEGFFDESFPDFPIIFQKWKNNNFISIFRLQTFKSIQR